MEDGLEGGKIWGDHLGSLCVIQMKDNCREQWSNWKEILEVESRGFGDWLDLGVKGKEDVRMTPTCLVWAANDTVYIQESFLWVTKPQLNLRKKNCQELVADNL